MQQILNNLKKQLANFLPTPTVSANKWTSVLNKTTVVLMAGGESNRFKEVTGASGANKNAFTLPNGSTLIEMTINMYKNAGIKNFVALLYYKGEAIEDLLGNGSKYGVNIKYSYDPGPVGKGGAIKNAYLNNTISNDNYLIIQNPDDVFIGYEEKFVKKILTTHLQAEKNGCVATVVVVGQTPYNFTGMKINKSKVTQIKMYPNIPIPTHVGTTVFSAGLKSLFSRQFSFNKKTDFEQKLFPILCKQNKLYSCLIPDGYWIAVNNAKAYKQLLNKLKL